VGQDDLGSKRQTFISSPIKQSYAGSACLSISADQKRSSHKEQALCSQWCFRDSSREVIKP